MKEIKSVNDIKSGYVVRIRNGLLYMCMRSDQNNFCKIGINKKRWISLDPQEYIGLKHKNNIDFDIVEVYGLSILHYKALEISTANRPLLYKEVTMQEVEKIFGCKVKIVADDEV